MIAGYVTYEELKIITGYTQDTLDRLIIDGMRLHELSYQGTGPFRNYLFNLEEVENWLRVNIF